MKLLLTTEKLFTETEKEADKLVQDRKNQYGDQIKKTSIDRKFKKEQEFFIVEIQIEYLTVNDIVG